MKEKSEISNARTTKSMVNKEKSRPMQVTSDILYCESSISTARHEYEKCSC